MEQQKEIRKQIQELRDTQEDIERNWWNDPRIEEIEKEIEELEEKIK